MRVFINPGHALGGNPDPGCVNPALHLRECDLAMAYGSLCGKYLEAAGSQAASKTSCFGGFVRMTVAISIAASRHI